MMPPRPTIERPNATPERYTSPWASQIRINEDGTFETYTSSENYHIGNPNLPISKYREHIIRTIGDNLVTIISAPTGTGKSTNIPQMLLETGLYDHITMTQPRIVAARNVSERIAEEMTEALGVDSSNLVGYRTAHEGNSTDESKITVCTDGLIVMKMLKEGELGPKDVVMIDEFHERNLNMDLLLALCLQKGVRVVIASATIDIDKLSQYCSEQLGGANIPVIEVPGIMHEVEVRQGDSFSKEIIRGAKDKRNILAFVPGRKEAQATMSKIARDIPPGYTVLFLNADQTLAEQQKCFESYPGGKIILATSIAQTSLTIPDIDMVVDCGYERTGKFKEGVQGVPIQACSQATSMQRKGRVGRVERDRLDVYVRAPLENYPSLPIDLRPYDEPEIKKVNLASARLRLALGGIALDSYTLLDKPNPREVEAAQQKLIRFGAAALDVIDLTDTGEKMAAIPIDIHYSRMIVESQEKYSTQVQLQMLAASAVRQVKGIGSNVQGEQMWMKLARLENRSEILLQLGVFIAALRMDEAERSRYGIIEQRFIKAKLTYEVLAEEMGLDPLDLVEPTEENRQALVACIIAGSNELFVLGKKGDYRDVRAKFRSPSLSSNLDGSYPLIVGTPFDVSRMNKTGPRVIGIINDGTGVTVDELQRYAPDRCSDEAGNLRVSSDGTVMQQYLILFDGVSTRQYRSGLIDSSPEVQEIIIRNLIVRRNSYWTPSEHVKNIYNSVDELWEIQNRTAEDLGLDTLLVEFMKQRIPEDGTNVEDAATYVDIEDIKALISQEKRQEILSQAPDAIEIDVNGTLVMFNVKYFRNTATLFTESRHVPFIPEYIPELGDREIMVNISGGHSKLLLAKAKASHDGRPRRVRRETGDKVAGSVGSRDQSKPSRDKQGGANVVNERGGRTPTPRHGRGGGQRRDGRRSA